MSKIRRGANGWDPRDQEESGGAYAGAGAKIADKQRSRSTIVFYILVLVLLYGCATLYTVSSTLRRRVELLEEDLSEAQKDRKAAMDALDSVNRATADIRKSVVEEEIADDRRRHEDVFKVGGGDAMAALQRENQQLLAEISRMNAGRASDSINSNNAGAVINAQQQPQQQRQQPGAPQQNNNQAASPPNNPSAPAPLSPASADEVRRNAVKEAFRHSWRGYREYAWGQDELHPLTRSGNNWLGQGSTIVDSLDTALIMGLQEEFQQGLEWIKNSLTWDNGGDVSFFETTIRSLGGLIATYELSGDAVFLNKARDLGDRLLAAFSSPAGLPWSIINLRDRTTRVGWTGNSLILAEIGTVQLEMLALSRHTGDPKYGDTAMRALKTVCDHRPPNGLFPIYVDAGSGSFTTNQVSLGALGDSFFEYLLKVWIYNGKKDDWLKQAYDAAMDGILAELIQVSNPSRMIYIAEKKDGALLHKMDHLACFVGGMFALGANFVPAETAGTFRQVAGGITDTCYQMYARQPTGLAPEFVTFGMNDMEVGAAYNIQRPEAMESIFYMWRTTHDEKYRDMGWAIFQAFEKWTKIPSGGYVGVRDVRSVPPPQDDTQQTFWFAETLKYLYLLFSEDELIPLDQYVFNTEAHPLKINL